MFHNFRNIFRHNSRISEELSDPISQSIQQNDKTTLQQLLEECKKTKLPRPTNHLKWTVLHEAASQPQYKECLELLLDYSNSICLNINAQTRNGETALHIACQYGCADSTSLLLQKGCNPYKVTSRSNNSALHIAAANGYSKIVEYLVEYPENINKRDCSGLTPLHLAVENDSLESCRILLEKGANPTSTDLQKNIPLHLACRKRNFDMIRLLVEYDSTPINYENSDKMTPIMFEAGHSADPRATIFLHENGAKTDICDKQGRMALHFAVNSGNTELLQYVLQHTDASCIQQWFLDIPEILRTECILHSFTGCAIHGGNVECLKILLSSDKFSRSILQAPFVKRGPNNYFFNVYSPLAYVFSKLVNFEDEKLNSYLELLLKYKITVSDEFFEALEIVWPQGHIYFHNPFSKIFNKNWPISKQLHYFYWLKTNDVTLDYCLQCYYHDNTEPFATFIDYKAYYEPVIAVAIDNNLQGLKLIMSNSAILEPDEVLVELNFSEMNFVDSSDSDESMNVLETIDTPDVNEFRTRFHSINQYLISLKPIYHKQTELCERINGRSWYPYSTVGEEFSQSTLQQLCRTTIRQSLREHTLGDNLRNFRRNILELPLPTKLKDYLLFEG
ncbi:hypothetical protein V9T40_011144 [Parthenolecanium corni]|uniref:SOCS box domain-containing protein n=1 Tax=Parthenolecanium corni TaxID=536013 RepID=A0AAN9T4Y9_9HEMI